MRNCAVPMVRGVSGLGRVGTSLPLCPGAWHLRACEITGNFVHSQHDPLVHFHPKVYQIIKSLSGLLSIMQINLLFKSEWNISSLS